MISAITGLKRNVYAIMTDNDLETYGAIKEAPPIMNIKVSPKTNTAKLYANNRVVETATNVSDIAIEAELQALPLEVQADLLGHALDVASGSMVYNTGDKAPYVAFGYQRTKANGKNVYVWLRKVKFEEVSEETVTQGETIAFQTPKLSGTAIEDKNGNWKHIADDDTKGTAVGDYLATIPTSGAPDLVAPTVSTVPLDAATGVAVGASIVFTFNKAINIADMNSSHFFLLKAGVPVACGLVASAGNTIVTMKPTVNMSVGAHMAVCTTDVRSASGVALAAVKTVNFTV